MSSKYASLEDRLLANSRPEDTGFTLAGEPSECWVWIGNRDDDGYGRVTLRVDGKHKKVRAHRLAHEVFRGVKLTPEETLDHLCLCKACIHPNHTEAISNSENVKRMQDRWRNWRADQAGQTRMELAE